MVASVRLARSWEDLYRHRPLLTLFYHCHPHKRLRPLHLGRTAVVGDFPCLVDAAPSVPNHSIKGRKLSRENWVRTLCSLRRAPSTKTYGSTSHGALRRQQSITSPADATARTRRSRVSVAPAVSL